MCELPVLAQVIIGIVLGVNLAASIIYIATHFTNDKP